MVHAACVFVDAIHTSLTRMPGSSESMRWNICVHRLDLGLYSCQKVKGNGVKSLFYVNSKGKKIPFTGSSEEG